MSTPSGYLNGIISGRLRRAHALPRQSTSLPLISLHPVASKNHKIRLPQSVSTTYHSMPFLLLSLATNLTVGGTLRLCVVCLRCHPRRMCNCLTRSTTTNTLPDNYKLMTLKARYMHVQVDYKWTKRQNATYKNGRTSVHWDYAKTDASSVKKHFEEVAMGTCNACASTNGRMDHPLG